MLASRLPRCLPRDPTRSRPCLPSSPNFTLARLRPAAGFQQQHQRRHQVSRRPKLCCNASSAAGAAPSDDSSSSGSSAPAQLSQLEQGIASVCKTLTNLFPLWVVLAAVVAYHHPPLFTWFTDTSVTYALVFCMLCMGLTLTFEEITSVFTRSPQLLLLGMVLQYSVLPLIGWAISRHWGLSSSLAVGVALVSCMPGGTASNIVAYIAKGDMPLSIMMTTASTLMAVFTTPLLTNLLVGTLVPVDPQAMFLSVVQLVLAPVILGTALNQYFPKVVARLRVYTPFLATLLVVAIVGSMISRNVDVVSRSGWTIITAVLTLHSCGFGLGYFISKAFGLSDKICRTNSIEVGMQNSALAAVFARVHFPDQPMAVVPCVLSACTHATLGSILAGVGMQSSALAAVLAKIHFPQDPMIVAPCVLSACTHAVIGSLLAGWWNATAKD